jgi:selenocysteine-specific elongation factor
VLDAFPLPQKEYRQKQKKEARLAFLKTLAVGTRQETLLARIGRRGPQGLSLAAAARETGLKPAVLQPLIAALAQQKQIVTIHAGEFLLSSAAFALARENAISAVSAFHKTNPLVAGIGKEELREKLGLHQVVMEAVLAELVRDKKAEVAGEQVRLAGRGVELKDDEARAKEQIEKAFAAAGLRVPLMKDVLAALPVDKTRAQKLVTLLLRDRVLVKLADELVFHQSALQGLRRLVAQQKVKSPKIDVGQFKDLIGVTRKYAIPLLEYLDRERVTRRVGDERIIL